MAETERIAVSLASELRAGASVDDEQRVACCATAAHPSLISCSASPLTSHHSLLHCRTAHSDIGNRPMIMITVTDSLFAPQSHAAKTE